MRLTWVGKGGWSAVLVMMVGCWTTQPNLKPPPHPEEFILPPEETRFSNPPELPKEAIKENPVKRNLSETGIPGQPGPGARGPSFGAGPGMGGR